jgi:ABC-type hemin transport system ATPase subunit
MCLSCSSGGGPLFAEMSRRLFLSGLLGTVGAASLGLISPLQAEAAVMEGDAVYFGGDIMTMEGDEPSYVEAVLVRDGRIAFAGNRRRRVWIVRAACHSAMFAQDRLAAATDKRAKLRVRGKRVAHFRRPPRIACGF